MTEHETLTVARLIEILEHLPPEAPIGIPDRGCGCCAYSADVEVNRIDMVEGRVVLS